MNKKVQKGGRESTNFQAETVSIVNGLNYYEVRQVALDIFKANFYELAGEARKIAEERAQKITDDFLKKLQEENSEGFKKSTDPDFQYALYTIQKEYARNGDEELGDLLVDLLVDRSKQDMRDIKQIVLNESLVVAPKLTKEHLSALSICFLFRYTQNTNVGNFDLLGKYFDDHLKPFYNSIPTNLSSYQHLQFAGCGSITVSVASLERIIGTTYQGLFLKGFDAEEIDELGLSINKEHSIFMKCLNDSTKMQVRANNKEGLEENMKALSIPLDDHPKIVNLFTNNKMNDNEIKEKCIEIRPYMQTVFEKWSDSDLKKFTLTSVGISIGHANIKRLVGEFADLSIWIN